MLQGLSLGVGRLRVFELLRHQVGMVDVNIRPMGYGGGHIRLLGGRCIRLLGGSCIRLLGGRCIRLLGGRGISLCSAIVRGI